jgi:hypothetical protein
MASAGMTAETNMPRPDALQCALWYVQRLGWAVFPVHGIIDGACDCARRDCGNPGKHPSTPHGLLDASKDQDVIRRWWQQWPAANIGLATGERSGVDVLDVDPRHYGNETLWELEREHGELPATVMSLTGGGGCHLFFGHSPGLKSINGFAEGLDFKTNGGYVILPPSIHASGRLYEWEGASRPSEIMPAALPGWLQALAVGRKDSPGPSVPAKAVGAKILTGQRNQALTSLAGSMRRRGMASEEIMAALAAVNERRCDPRLTESELRQIAESVGRYEPGAQIGAQSAVPGGMSGAEVFNLPDREPVMVIGNTLYHGYTLLAGRPKGGKSWFGLQIGLAVACGMPLPGAEGRSVSPGRVLYLALEDSPRRTSRRMHLLLGNQNPGGLENLNFTYLISPFARGGRKALDGAIAEQKPSLVVIDTLRAFMNGGPAGDDVVGQEYSFADSLHKLAAAHQTAILVLHHTNKLGSVAGTYATLAGADAVWLLKRDPGEQDATLEITGRDLEEQSLALRFLSEGDSYGWHVIGEGSEALSRPDRAEILSVLRIEGPQRLGQIAAKLRKPYGFVLRLAEQMDAAGEVFKRNGKYHARVNGE